VQITSFAEIESEFIERVHRMAWCAVATVDEQNRPWTRALHTIWEVEGPTGWLGTRRHSPKERHLAHSPYVSLAYTSDLAKPAYVNATAEWVDVLAEKQRIWDLFKAAPPPLGYDPAPIFIAPDDAGFGLLKITPWQIRLWDMEHGYRIWQR
jgi:general stress protein 26